MYLNKGNLLQRGIFAINLFQAGKMLSQLKTSRYVVSRCWKLLAPDMTTLSSRHSHYKIVSRQHALGAPCDNFHFHFRRSADNNVEWVDKQNMAGMRRRRRAETGYKNLALGMMPLFEVHVMIILLDEYSFPLHLRGYARLFTNVSLTFVLSDIKLFIVF